MALLLISITGSIVIRFPVYFTQNNIKNDGNHRITGNIQPIIEQKTGKISFTDIARVSP